MRARFVLLVGSSASLTKGVLPFFASMVSSSGWILFSSFGEVASFRLGVISVGFFGGMFLTLCLVIVMNVVMGVGDWCLFLREWLVFSVRAELSGCYYFGDPHSQHNQLYMYEYAHESYHQFCTLYNHYHSKTTWNSAPQYNQEYGHEVPRKQYKASRISANNYLSDSKDQQVSCRSK